MNARTGSTGPFTAHVVGWQGRHSRLDCHVITKRRYLRMKRGMLLTALSVAALALAVTGIALARNGAKSGGPTDCTTATGSNGTVTWDKAVLWPPNHKLIPVTFTWTEPSSVTSSTATHQLSVTGVSSVGSDQGSGQPTSKQSGGADYSPTTF